MKVISSSEVPLVDRVGRIGRVLLNNYMGDATKVSRGPQAYLTELPENGQYIAPHFHDVDQFQIVVGGQGTLGKAEVRPFAFHYADAFTPYGPIIASERGIRYLTVRLAASGGSYGMPGARHLLPGKPGRNLTGVFEADAKIDPGVPVARQPLIERKEDGLAATLIRIAPNTSATGLPPEAGGQYCLVCSGPAMCSGKQLPALSLLFLEHGEPAPELRAGPAGAVLLILQFPRPSERPGSDPSKLGDRDPNSSPRSEGYAH